MTTIRFYVYLLLAVAAYPAIATSQETKYSINLEGVSEETGHRLRAFGTITLDLSRPTLAAVRSSKIFIQHENDAPLALKSLPNQLGIDPRNGLQWEVIDKQLYINRISTLNGIIQWNTEASLPQFTSLFFESGPPNNPHGMFYRFGHDDTVILKSGGPPDGPRGFLVGVLIPEPSSAVLIGGAGAAFLSVRRRRS